MGQKVIKREYKILKLQAPLFSSEGPELLCHTADMKLCYRTTDPAHIEAIGKDLKAYWRVEVQYVSKDHVHIVFIEKVEDPALHF